MVAARLAMVRFMEDTTLTNLIPLSPRSKRINRNTRNRRKAGITKEMAVSQFFLTNSNLFGARTNYQKINDKDNPNDNA